MFTTRNRATPGVLIPAVISGLMACGAALAQEVGYDYDRNADFAKYKTYKWVLVEQAAQPDQLTDKDITQAVDEQLATKALTKKDSDPVDLLVGYHISVGQQTQITAFGAGPSWRYGGSAVSAGTSTINVGTLVLDMYAPATNSLVWRGSATETVVTSGDPDKRMKRLQKSMAKLLKHYPPPPASKSPLME